MENITIDTSQGRIKGVIRTDFDGGKYSSFTGVPFAQPPIGTLRFKPPVPKGKWIEDVWDATYCRDRCYQLPIGESVASGTEDCLYLNIYTPKTIFERGSDEKLPVLVWIHGGGFNYGSHELTHTGPEFLMPKKVILVTVGYRVNIFGFFSLSKKDLNITGNQGLKDQVEALRWIQKNITSYGGDPNNVTISGQSAGASCVQLHLVSPLAKGLFNKATIQSGSAMSAWALNEDCHDGFFEAVGAGKNQTLEFLQGLSTEEVFKGLTKLNNDNYASTENYSGIRIGVFIPTLEPPHPGAYLTEPIKTIVARGDFAKVPVMIGYCETEGFIFMLDMPGVSFEGKRRYITSELVDKIKDSARVASVEDEIKRFYFGDRDAEASVCFGDRARFASDSVFNHGIVQAARVMIPHVPVYFYKFCAATEINYMKRKIIKKLPPALSHLFDGVCTHCDELTGIYTNEDVPRELMPPGSVERKIVDFMSEFWANFVKFGDPNGTKTERVWEPVLKSDGNNLKYLKIGNDGVEMHVNPDHERIAFWDELFARYGV